MTIKNQLVTLIVPKQNEVGSFIHLLINDEIYLIHDKTNQKLHSRIKNLPDGKYRVQISGLISQETGYFPNPMEKFDLIELVDFTIL